MEEENRTRAVLLAPAFCSRQAQGQERSCTPIVHLLSFSSLHQNAKVDKSNGAKRGWGGSKQGKEQRKDGGKGLYGIDIRTIESQNGLEGWKGHLKVT